jgi:TetR/AcrR family transcriptional regulator
MAERRSGRVHNAAGAREAMLTAATTLFAAHGFAGAPMQAIALAAGYDKSLLFQYFGDKLGLYTAVIERIIRQIVPADMAATLATLLADASTPRDPHKLRAVLETVIRGNFDILRSSPVACRLLAWEAAEEWQTFKRLHERGTGPSQRFERLITEAQRAGLIYPDLDPAVILTLIQDVSQMYLTALPRLPVWLGSEDVLTEQALTNAREQLTAIITRGILVSPVEAASSPDPTSQPGN